MDLCHNYDLLLFATHLIPLIGALCKEKQIWINVYFYNLDQCKLLAMAINRLTLMITQDVMGDFTPELSTLGCQVS